MKMTLSTFKATKCTVLIDPISNTLVPYRPIDVATVLHEARTWQNSNVLSQRERKRLECRNKGSRRRRIETRGCAREGGGEETGPGGWDKLKELSKLSTSTAGLDSHQSRRPFLCSAFCNARPCIHICSCTCATRTILRNNAHVSEYTTVRVHSIRICLQTRIISVSVYKRTAAPSVQFAHSVIYLFIYSEQPERARHFMNTILDAFAPIFPKIRKNIPYPRSDFAQTGSWTNLFCVSLSLLLYISLKTEVNERISNIW